jgi:chromosome segregation ATPase
MTVASGASLTPLMTGDLDQTLHANLRLRQNLEKLMRRVSSLQEGHRDSEERVRLLGASQKSGEHREQLLVANNAVLLEQQQATARKLAALEEEHVRVGNELAAARQRCELGDGEITRLRDALGRQTQEHSERVNRLLSDVAVVEAQRSDLQQRCVRANDAAALLQADNKAKDAQLRAAALEQEELVQKHALQADELARVQSQLGGGVAEVEAMRESVKELQAALEDTQKLLSNAKAAQQHRDRAAKLESEQARVKIEILEESAAQMRAQHEENTRDVSQARSRVSQLESELKRVETQLEASLERERAADDANKRLTGDGEHLRLVSMESATRVGELEVRLAAAERDRDEHQEMVAKLSEEIETVFRPAEERERAGVVRIQELESKLSATLRTVGMLNKDLTQSRAEIEALKDQADAQERSVATLVASRQTLQQEVAWLKQQAKGAVGKGKRR